MRTNINLSKDRETESQGNACYQYAFIMIVNLNVVRINKFRVDILENILLRIVTCRTIIVVSYLKPYKYLKNNNTTSVLNNTSGLYMWQKLSNRNLKSD